MEHDNMHMMVMAVACIAALVLVIALPTIGLSGEWILLAAIAAMVLMHVWMMKGHSGHGHQSHSRYKENKRGH